MNQIYKYLDYDKGIYPDLVYGMCSSLESDFKKIKKRSSMTGAEATVCANFKSVLVKCGFY